MATIPQSKNVHVLLADDRAAIIAQTTLLLADEFAIVGSVSNGLNLVTEAARLDPDVIVLDITMPGLDGIEVARRLRRTACRAKLVFLSVHEDADYVSAALQAGGAAYVLKPRLATDLVTAIHEVLAGRRFVSPSISPEDVP